MPELKTKRDNTRVQTPLYDSLKQVKNLPENLMRTPPVKDSSKYGQAARKLTDTQKVQMRDEYQQALEAGKTKYTSKVTGLEYLVPENDSKTYNGGELQEVVVQATKTEYNKRKEQAQQEKEGLPLTERFLRQTDKLINRTLPTTVGSYLNSKYRDRNTLDNESFSPEEKSVAYKLVENARKRTGKDVGGTDYQDYKGLMPEKDYKALQKLVAGKITKGEGGARSMFSPAYNLAATLGRVSYAADPHTGNTIISDVYDFKNNFTQDKEGKLKKDYLKDASTDYQKERRSLAEQSQHLTSDQISKRKVTLDLSPSDTVGYPVRTKQSLGSKLIDEGQELAVEASKILKRLRKRNKDTDK